MFVMTNIQFRAWLKLVAYCNKDPHCKHSISLPRMRILQHTVLVMSITIIETFFCKMCFLNYKWKWNETSSLAQVTSVCTYSHFSGQDIFRTHAVKGQDVSVAVRMPKSIWALPFTCHSSFPNDILSLHPVLLPYLLPYTCLVFDLF